MINAQLGSSPSQIWRETHEGIGVLKLGLAKRIGNGMPTNIWDQNWIPREEHLHVITSRGMLERSFLSELIDHTYASWREDVLRTKVLPMDVRAILSIPLSSVSQPDRWVWIHEINGYSVLGLCIV
jgi:hypothetical protein